MPVPSDLKPSQNFKLKTTPKDDTKKPTTEISTTQTILFSAGTTDNLSTTSKDYLKSAMKDAGVSSITITSTSRTTKEQAEVMHSNCVKNGVAEQKVTYGQDGKKVIEVYETGTKEKKTKDQIIDLMDDKIQEIKKSNKEAFKHTADSSKLNVFDIGHNSIKPAQNKSDLETKLKSNSKIDKLLNENGCFHLEITQ